MESTGTPLKKLKWSAIPDLRSTMSYLPLPFCPDEYKRREVAFPSPYITPRLQYLSSTADPDNPPPFSTTKKPPYIFAGNELINMAHLNNPILIFGQPFSGKTCIFLKMIEQVNSVYGQKHWLRMLDLRTAALKYLVSGRRPANFYELVADQLHVSERSIRDTFKPVRNAKELLRKKRFDKLIKGELILDGLDEIPESIRNCFLKLIPQMKQNRQDCSIRVWIGCRSYLKTRVLSLLGDESAFEIVDYDPNMQKSLLYWRWKQKLYPKSIKKHEEERLWEYTHILHNELCKQIKNFDTTLGTVPFYLEVIASIFNNHVASFMQLYYTSIKGVETPTTGAIANGQENDKGDSPTAKKNPSEALSGKNKKKKKKNSTDKKAPKPPTPPTPPPKENNGVVKVPSCQLLCQISGIFVVEFLEYLIFTAIDIYCLKFHYKRSMKDEEYKNILEREYRRATRLYAEYAIITFNTGYEYQTLIPSVDAETGVTTYVPNLDYVVEEDLHHIGFLLLHEEDHTVRMRNKFMGDFFLAKQFACPDNMKKSNTLFDNFFLRDLLIDVEARYIRGFMDNILHFAVREWRSELLHGFLVKQYKLGPGQEEEWEQVRNDGSVWHMAVMEGFHQTALSMIKCFDPVTEREQVRKLLRIRLPLEIYEAAKTSCAVCQVSGGNPKGRHLLSPMSLVALFSYSGAMEDLLKMLLQYFTIEEIREEFTTPGRWTPMHYAAMHSNLWFFMHVYNNVLVEIKPPPGVHTPMGQLPIHLLMSYCWYHIMIFNDRFIEPYDSLAGCDFTACQDTSLSPDKKGRTNGANGAAKVSPATCCSKGHRHSRDVIGFKHMIKELHGPGNLLRVTHHECIRLLVGVGGEDINACEHVSGNTMLHYATLTDNLESVKYLLELGADYDAKNKHGKTPLHFAGLHGHREIFMCLVKTGAKATVRDNKGNSPISLWTQYGEASDKARRTTPISMEDQHFFKACADIDKIIQEQFARLQINADAEDEGQDNVEGERNGSCDPEEEEFSVIIEGERMPELSQDEDLEDDNDYDDEDDKEEENEEYVVGQEAGDEDEYVDEEELQKF